MWTVIPEFPTYEASTDGHVRNSSTLRVLRESGDGTGYLLVHLRKDGKGYTRKVHTLVAQAFLTKPSRTLQVNHISGDKSDNSVSNLEMVTQEENQAHALKNNLKPHKLTEDDVRDIRKRLKSGANQYELAKMFGVAQGRISAIKLGNAYSWVI